MALPYSVIAVLGATGVGKSQLAVDLALKYKGEVISCDSMQVYKGLDRTTNKITTEEMNGIRHHMLSCVDTNEVYTVVQYRDAVLKLIDAICLRGNVPILCGGTSYYAEAILQCSLIDEEDGPPAVDLQFLAKSNHDYTFDTLLKIDPKAAANIHPNNARKVQRALAVYYQTGTTYTQWLHRQRDRRKDKSPFRFKKTLVLWMYCDLSVLDSRLDTRVDIMFKEGALEEMRQVVATCKDENKEAVLDCADKFAVGGSPDERTDTPDFTKGIWQNLGLKEMYPFLTTGENYKVCVDNMKRGTRRYARRQLTWLRGHFASYINIPVNTWAESTADSDEKAIVAQERKIDVVESSTAGEQSVLETECAPDSSVVNSTDPDTQLSSGTENDNTSVGESGHQGGDNTTNRNYSVKTDPEMNVYVIDGTNTAEYTQSVLPRAVALVKEFLSDDPQREMPLVDIHRDLPDDIRESLRKANSRVADKLKRYCDTCDISVLGDDVWLSHTRGKKHKALNKRHKKSSEIVACGIKTRAES